MGILVNWPSASTSGKSLQSYSHNWTAVNFSIRECRWRLSEYNIKKIQTKGEIYHVHRCRNNYLKMAVLSQSNLSLNSMKNLPKQYIYIERESDIQQVDPKIHKDEWRAKDNHDNFEGRGGRKERRGWGWEEQLTLLDINSNHSYNSTIKRLNLKMGKWSKQIFLQRWFIVTNKHKKKKCSTSLVISEMQKNHNEIALHTY